MRAIADKVIEMKRRDFITLLGGAADGDLCPHLERTVIKVPGFSPT